MLLSFISQQAYNIKLMRRASGRLEAPCYNFSVAVKQLQDAVPRYAVKRRRGPAALFDLSPNLAMCAYWHPIIQQMTIVAFSICFL
ncbi:MAG: hypothetical protein ACI88A_005201 [Paraglaciecola sp.]|jgi:hypothetical protein